MNQDLLKSLAHIPDQELLARIKTLLGFERKAMASLIAHLAELEERRLYCDEGFSSLFTYCTQALHLSEFAAYNRIMAARAARKFPIIIDWLANGSVHLTAVRLLAPCLTDENHLEMLESARHKNRKQVEELVAGVNPLPAIPATVRKLPVPGSGKTIAPPPQPPTATGSAVAAPPDQTIGGDPAAGLPSGGPDGAAPRGVQGMSDLLVPPEGDPQPPVETMADPQPPVETTADRPPVETSMASFRTRPAIVTPLAPDRYRVQFGDAGQASPGPGPAQPSVARRGRLGGFRSGPDGPAGKTPPGEAGCRPPAP